MFICFSTQICLCCIRLSLSDYFGKTVLSTSMMMNHVSQVARSHLCCSIDMIGPVRMQYVFQYLSAPTFPTNHALSRISPHTRLSRSFNYKQRAHCCLISPAQGLGLGQGLFWGGLFLKEQKQMRVTSCEKQ